MSGERPPAPGVRVIAEAGVNHDGSPERALALVDAAAGAGADVVKFQTFKAEALVSRGAPKAGYQLQTTGAAESQLDMLRRLELTPADHVRLIARCAERGVEFLSTPFDRQSLELLADLFGLPQLKLGSGELTDAPLLLAAGRTGKSLYLSTGMATLDEVRTALGVLAYGFLGGDEPSRDAFAAAFASPEGRAALHRRVTLLHCTSAYPTPFDEVNLRAMDTLRDAFGLPVGLSDHSSGIAVAIAAAARGAAVIEKHFTLDRDLPGPDHRASLEPGELAAMIRAVRQVEAALGDGHKAPAAAERETLAVARKSLVAARPIRRGETFSAANLAVKRPAGGVPPIDYWQTLGRRARRDFVADERIEP